MYFKLGAMLMLIISLAACNSTPKNNEQQMLFVKPLQVSTQQQLAIKRLSDILGHVNLTEEQQAEVYFQRGRRYDEIGLNQLAHFDFNQALRLKQNLAEAYNYIGIYYTLEQDFANAYDAFDSVQELKPGHSFAYLNRGIALYYGKRYELAVDDLQAFIKEKPQDPYPVIWLYLAQREVNAEQAYQGLQQAKAQLDPNNWAISVIDLYLGKSSPDDFITGLRHLNSAEVDLTKQACEAYFYLAKYYQQTNEPLMAETYFKLALATNVYEYVEHRYANLELTRINSSKN
ncbi:lipoprotein NlpI [Saccharobesus litoralis]|uniref:Lipoprotein NlpI n=1 Tax=Saccharobesus litoralis TaxID=2172099 RepID=A0A2S0VS98_9ALTE|nr:lipoprotein NlpI [Saccharobesus litoralis]AWB67088.1 lipoprotein NlpI [Saccharobesus litoralis]